MFPNIAYEETDRVHTSLLCPPRTKRRGNVTHVDGEHIHCMNRKPNATGGLSDGQICLTSVRLSYHRLIVQLLSDCPTSVPILLPLSDSLTQRLSDSLTSIWLSYLCPISYLCLIVLPLSDCPTSVRLSYLCPILLLTSVRLSYLCPIVLLLSDCLTSVSSPSPLGHVSSVLLTSVGSMCMAVLSPWRCIYTHTDARIRLSHCRSYLVPLWHTQTHSNGFYQC